MMIGICGGIGSGKSVVSRILRLRGEAVYDCDMEAKRIMDGSREVMRALYGRYGEEVCPPEGPICRPELARRVFAGDDERIWLNSLVHRLVREDVAAWKAARLAEGYGRCFVESAIPATSGLTEMCGEMWIVTAPEEVRTERIKERDSLDGKEIRRRIATQLEEERKIMESGIAVRMIDNSGDKPLLPDL